MFTISCLLCADIELHTLDQQEERQNNDVNTLSIPNPAGDFKVDYNQQNNVTFITGIDRRETEKDHDKVDILSLTDLNFEMESMDKLFQLQFPKIHEGIVRFTGILLCSVSVLITLYYLYNPKCHKAI